LSSNFFFKFEIIDKATKHPNIKNIREIKARDFELSFPPEDNLKLVQKVPSILKTEEELFSDNHST
jgi:hypothetical protein